MAELQRHFRAGRMNKDLDERLVPNGEYRDAQNIEIITSEGSDVGSIQNVLGNTEKKGKTYNKSTGVLTASWSSNYISNLTGSKCIGSYVDNENNKIYWFITATYSSNPISVIAEYDDQTGVVAPILVDRNSILKFNTNYRITAINIVDGMLFWTDNQKFSTSENNENDVYSEPKQLKISKFKDDHATHSSGNFITHTQLTHTTSTVSSHTGTSTTVTLSEENVTIQAGMSVSGTNVAAGTTVSSISGTTLTLSASPSDVIIDDLTFYKDFREDDITVIKKFPQTAPKLTMRSSLRTGNGTGTDPVFCEFNFSHDPSTTGQYRLMDVGFKIDQIEFNVAEEPNWKVNDVIHFISSEHNAISLGTLEVKIRILSFIDGTKILQGQILSISQNIPVGPTTTTATSRKFLWRVTLVEDDPMFKYKFPRFGYRWKYTNGEYSCFSPFSEVAFLPGVYNFRPTEGHNAAMVNNIRSLVIDGFQTQPYNVDEVDILYKESNSEVVYIFDTLKNKETSYTIEKEIVQSVVEPSQLLRHWDNVPRAAKAQEMTGSRLLYGNYIQNYNLNKDNEPNIKSCFTPSPVVETQDATTHGLANGTAVYFWLSPDNFTDISSIEPIELSVKLGRPHETNPVYTDSNLSWEFLQNLSGPNSEPAAIHFTSLAPADGLNVIISRNKTGLSKKSIKSMRNYQLGVSYQDLYGRQTPIFPSEGGSMFLEKEFSKNQNTIHTRLLNEPPPWATSYRWYIKEPSAEYYNLALDRFYLAEDGNVWLSFPSSDGNKVKEGDYLILKKEHNTNETVYNKARYKILAIENEAPDFIKTVNISTAEALVTVRKNGNNSPTSGSSYIEFAGPEEGDNTAFTDNLTSGNFVRFSLGGNASPSGFYAITKGGLTGEQTGDNTVLYSLSIEPSIREVDNFLNPLTVTNNIGDTFYIEIFKKEERVSEEFAGRFFAKISRDDMFDTHVIDPSGGDAGVEYRSIASVKMEKDCALKLKANGKKLRNPKCFGWIDSPLKYRNPTGQNTISKDLWSDSWDYTGGFYGYEDDYQNAGKPSRQTEHGAHHPEHGNKKVSFCVAGFPWTNEERRNTLDCSNENHDYKHEINVNRFMEHLNNGSYIQFEGVTNATTGETKRGKVYQIKRLEKIAEPRHGRNYKKEVFQGKMPWPNSNLGKPWTARQVVLFELYDPVTLEEGYFDDFIYETEEIVKVHIMKPDYADQLSQTASNDAAVFETEPQETPDLDLYYEISDSLGIIKRGMSVSIDSSNTTSSTIAANTVVTNVVPTVDEGDNNNSRVDFNNQQTLAVGTVLKFTNSINGVTAIATVQKAITSNRTCEIGQGGHCGEYNLSWYNCYAFGNGVESNRIKDDFNTPIIDHGPKVSTIPAEQYKEENRKSGLIWSGIYNSISGINKLNEFNIAEKITKDINPEYGSIQKLHSRDTDVTTLCEDKIIRILANKDALFNADGNVQLTATHKVLGQAIPYLGEYGIGKNPESFISHAYRSYFVDKNRGAVLRLSRDGVENISRYGMTDWFKDNLLSSTELIGNYNEDKGSYNLTVKGTTDYTLSFDERINGWTSFKSFILEDGCSLNNEYYTFYNGLIWNHDTTANRNTFYGTYYESSVNLLFNDDPTLVKNFKTLNYEGSTSREYNYGGTIHSVAYTSGNNNLLTLDRLVELKPTNGYQDDGSTLPTSTQTTKGWYAKTITTDLQSGDIQEFYKKEGKWFNYIHGDVTVFDNDNTSSNNVDTSEFSVQGIDTLASISGDTSVTEARIIIDLDGITAQKMSIDTSRIPSGWTIDPDNNERIYKDHTVGANIGSSGVIANPTVYLVADTGYTLPSSLSIATESPSSSINISSWTQSTGALVLDIEDHTLTTSGRTIVITLSAPATDKPYSIAGIYNWEVENTSSPDSTTTIPTDVAYSDTGTYKLREEIFNVTVTASTGYKFRRPATGRVIKQNDSTAKYEFIHDNWVYNSANELTSVRIKVYYTYGDETAVAGDEIDFKGICVKSSSDIGGNIAGYQWENEDGDIVQGIIPSGGETRYLRIFGKLGVTYGLSCDTSNVKMLDSTDDIADKILGKTKEGETERENLSKTDLIKVEFPPITSNTTHTFELLGTNLASTLIPNENPFTIKQLTDTTVSLVPTSARFTASHITVYEDDNRDGIFNTSANSADNITRTYPANRVPNENSKEGFIPFKFTFNDSSAITLTRQPRDTDFTKLARAEMTLQAAASGTLIKVVSDDDALDTTRNTDILFVGATVSGENVQEGVTIASITSSTEITLNKNICENGIVIPKDHELFFDNNGTEVTVDFDTASVSSNILTVSGDIFINQYGEENITSNFNVDNFISGGATSDISIQFILASADGSIDLDVASPHTIGVVPSTSTDGTLISTYATILGTGIFAGNANTDVTLTYSIHADSDPEWIEPGTVSGPSNPPSSRFDNNFTLLNPITFTTNNNTTSSSVYKIIIDISLANPTV